MPKVWKAQEIIYKAHTKHGSHLKVELIYRVFHKNGIP